MNRRWFLCGAGLAVGAGALLIPVGGKVAQSVPESVKTAPTFADVSASRPEKPLSVLFIHHSCGGQLLAPKGPEKGDSCIYEAHPSGGNLRPDLEREGYAVHEASYGSKVGDRTDLFDWLPKFSHDLATILRTKYQDELLPADEKNRVVIFKSCFPNNQFVGQGAAPGDLASSQLTVWNARATLSALLPVFEKHPETLFVYVTAPPMAQRTERMPLYRWLVRALKGRSEPAWTAQQARWARELNDWVVSEDGWLDGYTKKNVVVFDYYGVLTGEGKSNLLAFPPDDTLDSHPSSDGNRAAAALFVPFLNRAVRRAGIASPASDANPAAAAPPE